MDNTDAVGANENELADEATEDAQTPAVKPFWHSFTREDARLYWITFGATVAGTITAVIAVGFAGIVIRWLSSSTAPSSAICELHCPSGASPTIPAWAWFAAGVLVVVVFLIVVARRRAKRGETSAAPAALAMAVAIFGILVLLGYWYFR
jgi:hypothetical protein